MKYIINVQQISEVLYQCMIYKYRDLAQIRVIDKSRCVNFQRQLKNINSRNFIFCIIVINENCYQASLKKTLIVNKQFDYYVKMLITSTQ